MDTRPNLLDPRVRQNPYPLYAELRRHHPVYQVDPGGFWAVSRHADVLRVLRDPGTFSSTGFALVLQSPWVERNPIASSILGKDAPEHTRLRALVSRAFTPNNMARLEGRIAAYAAELGDRLLSLGEAEFVAEMGAPLPARVISGILGVDPALHEDFKHWSDAVGAITPVPPEPAVAAQIRSRLRAMEDYLRSAIADRRRMPREDIMNALLLAEVDGERLTDDEILSMLFLLLPAGIETTVNLMSKLMMVLADHPDVFERIHADRARIPAFIDEVLRFDSPVHGIIRLTTAEVELAGVTLPAGAMVLALVGAANRDESAFPDADRFDADRGSQGGLTFGHGVHFCLGSALARLEGRLMLEAILDRCSRVERLPGELSWAPSVIVHGPTTLPLRFIPR